MNDSTNPSSETPPQKPPFAALVVVYLTLFLDLLGFGIILPFLTYFAERHGATGFGVSLLLSAYSIAVFISAPLMGRLSDRIGRRPILLLALAGSTGAMILTGLADDLWLLLLGRLLAGAFGGSISIAQAYVADVSPRAERAKYMGLVGASIGMGFIFGPALGSLMSALGYGLSGAAFVAAGVTGLNLIFGYFKLPETHGKGGTRAGLKPSALLSALSMPGTGRILIATFLGTAAFVSMEATFALLGKARYGLNEARLGMVFAFVGVVGAIVQGGLIGRLSKRYGEQRLAIVGAILIAISLGILPYLPNFWSMIAAMVVLATGQGLASPALSTLLSKSVKDGDQGGVLGVGQGLGSLARATAPLLAGLLYDIGPDRPYWMAAGACVIAFFVLLPPLRLSPAAAGE